MGSKFVRLWKGKKMKTTKTLVLTVLLFLSLSAVTAYAQNDKKLSSTPRSFQTFFAKFRTAVLKGERKTVASMTQFPFEWAYDAGDEGTYSKSQFIKHFVEIFGEDRSLFSRKDPKFYVKGGTYNLTNEYDASHYIFKKKGTSYKFTGYFAEP